MKLLKNPKLDILIPRLSDKFFFEVQNRTSSQRESRINPKKDKYLQIDGSYIFKEADENYIQNLTKNIGVTNDNYDNICAIINEILKRTINTSFDDVFDYSLKLCKQINVEKESIEQLFKMFFMMNQSINTKTITLDISTLTAIGTILSYSFKKLENYKIKDYEKLKPVVKYILKNGVNIFTDYVVWCTSKNKNPESEKFYKFYDKNKKKYDIQPELLILLNAYQNVTTLILEIDTFKDPNLVDENYKLFELAILNLNWILSSLNTIKFNFMSKHMEKSLFLRKKDKYESFCSKAHYNVKPKDVFFNDIYYSKQKWDFSSKFQLINNKDINMEPLIEDLDYENQNEQNENRTSIVQKNSNLFDLIFISFFSLTFYDNKNIKFELVMNNCYSDEYYILFSEIYKLEWAKTNPHLFHILDLFLFNKLINNIQQLNIEINCLENKTFTNLLNFLYYAELLTKINISFFSSDITYLPHNIYSFYSGYFDNIESGNKELKKNFEKNTYLFCNIKEIEDKMLDKLYNNFVNSLATLFQIISSKKNLKELGFNFDVPFNIRNKSKYMNAIYKFILNILFFVSKQKIEKFCIFSPYTVIDTVTNPGIDNLINSINFNKNKYYEELTLQMQFFNLESINTLLNGRLRILNLGNLDLFTFKHFCDMITNYKFNKMSALQEITLGLMEIETEFTEEIKVMLGKLFSIKINSLSRLNLFTGLCLTESKMYLDFLKLVNNNWILNYFITFDDSSDYIVKKESLKIWKLKCLITYFLERRMTEFKNKKNRDIMNAIDNDSYWYLRYFFYNKYKPYVHKYSKQDETKEETIKKLIFEILKYVHVYQVPILIHDKNKFNEDD